jgi:hypothetical protein
MDSPPGAMFADNGHDDYRAAARLSRDEGLKPERIASPFR